MAGSCPWFRIALLASAGVHVVLAMTAPGPDIDVVERPPVRLSLVRAQTPAPAPAEQEPESLQPVPPTPPAPKPDPEVQPSSAARSVAPHPDPAPRRQELLPVGRGSDDPSDPTAPRAPDVAAIASGAVETPARDPRLSAPERENLLAAYLHTIRERVASHRRYPHSARRLGLEGTIRVQFHVDQCGDVSGMSLVIPSQHQLLRDASIEAIRASVPFPTPPKELGNGLDVEVSIVFRLGE